MSDLEDLGNGMKLVFHGEGQLIDYGESRTAGPYIKIRLPDPDALSAFRGMDTATQKRAGHILGVTITLGDIADVNDTSKDAAAVAKAGGKYGATARRLRLHGFHPKVVEALGTDQDFLDWLKGKACIVCGTVTLDHETGEPAGDPCHVRRANNSGTGYKPEYSAVPMCHTHHQQQHASNGKGGEVGCWLAAGNTSFGTDLVSAKEWFSDQAATHLKKWAWDTLKWELGVNSMSEASPDHIKEWAMRAGVLEYMTQEIQNA